MNNISSEYEIVIGLETHVQLKTNSKMFCSCSTEFGKPPNTNICPICTGQPGVLPVQNKRAIELTVLTGLALNCEISNYSIFARKNYFYPDLPKNYQISQYELPLCKNGYIEIKIGSKTKKIGITRIHLEEDAGKLLHAIGSKKLDYSLVDLNRAGIPLMEIVTEPDINSHEEAYIFLTTLKTILQYLNVSDCDMEKGLLRCDANISVHKKGEPLGVKTELKNMNSFKSVKDSLYYESQRQISALIEGEKIIQETRLWNTEKGITEPMRSKEESHDYRYFPEPDLVPIILTQDFIDNLRKTIPELPQDKKNRFITQYQIPEYDAGVITSDKILATFYEKTIKILNNFGYKETEVAKTVANWLTTELLGRLNSVNKTIEESPVSEENLAKLIKLIQDNTISGKIAKTVFDEMFNTGKYADEIVKEKGLIQITDESIILKLVDEVIKENSDTVNEYKSGKVQALGSLVGKVMKKTSGRANPQIVNKLLKEKLQ